MSKGNDRYYTNLKMGTFSLFNTCSQSIELKIGRPLRAGPDNLLSACGAKSCEVSTIIATLCTPFKSSCRNSLQSDEHCSGFDVIISSNCRAMLTFPAGSRSNSDQGSYTINAIQMGHTSPWKSSYATTPTLNQSTATE
jgi:hypothetical protein